MMARLFPARQKGENGTPVLRMSAVLVLCLGLVGCGADGEDAGKEATTSAREHVGGSSRVQVAAAGERVFADAGCGGCHTLSAAGAEGKVGPSLDDAELDYEDAYEQIRDGGGGMPAFGDRLSDRELADVTRFVVEASAP